MSRTRRPVVPDGRPVSSRGRVLQFEQLRAHVAEAEARDRAENRDKLRRLVHDWESSPEDRDRAVRLIEGGWLIVGSATFSRRCPHWGCGRRMAVSPTFTGFAWVCPAKAHPRRSIDPNGLAAWIAAEIHAQDEPNHRGTI